jgi:integrase
MARTVKNPQMQNRTQRAKIAARPDPYWHLIAEGQHLGYRKTGEKQGTWIARYYNKETKKRRWEALGAADDSVEANWTHVLSFTDALNAAQAWIKKVTQADNAGVRIGKYTVADAAKDWLATWRGSERGKETATANVELHILPTLSTIEIDKLNRVRVERWLHDQAKKAPLKVLRRRESTKKLSPSRQSKIVYDPSDPETQRKRKDSANRVFRDLKALLNRAYDNQHVASKAAWETVKEFENVDVAKNEYLTLDEAQRFLAVCPEDFRDLVQAALITGCRYGELCSMKTANYDSSISAVSIIQSKTGKKKDIFLTPDEAAFFDKHTDGKKQSDLMFLRTYEGTGEKKGKAEPWGKSHQQSRMEDVLKAAGISRHVRFHDLRHTFATLLAMNGTSLQLIANQLGHSGTRIAEKHYAHFSPSYVAATIRANKPSYAPPTTPASGPRLVIKAS